MSTRELLWSPPPEARERTRLGRFLSWLASRPGGGRSFGGYDELWAWSVDDLEGFWGALCKHADLPGLSGSGSPPGPVLDGRALPGARWWPKARLNYAQPMLAGVPGDAVAVLARSQTRGPVDLTGAQLADQVSRARAGLVGLGVGPGDRVAAYLPNIPETLVVFLATASLGAIWSSCAPEFGTRSVLDRFRQIEPKVLVAVDGYRYGNRGIDRRSEVAAIRAALPSLAATVAVPYLHGDPGALPGAVPWTGLLDNGNAQLEFEPVPFDHPLYILYSSGTTGLPKPIVHGHGGILVEHWKALALHHDLGPGDRFFWFSTTGWMMWNLLISGLLTGAAVVLFDGDPGSPDLGTLWRLAEETGTTYYGGSAPFFLSCRKAGIVPKDIADLSLVRAVGSTGAPLPPEGFRWIYEAVKPDVHLVSISGGTDVCTAFVGGSPLHPVRAGEIACRFLGAKVEAFDRGGKPVVGEQGELVISEPMPSMPVGFWGDSDGARYRAAYFDEFPGVWRHGDWITIDPDGSCVITGRSDATLNRGGVRLGTSEFYSVVEGLPEVADSLVIHLEDPEGGAGRLILFVVTAGGATLDDDLRRRITAELRGALSPRHVPDAIHAVPDVPRTLSGKKLEVPVKRIMMGTPTDVAASRGSMANPDSLVAFARLAGNSR